MNLNNTSSVARGDNVISITDIKIFLPFYLPQLERNFPSSWKIAIVKPLDMNPSPNELKDLRTISIFSLISKNIEKHINNHL